MTAADRRSEAPEKAERDRLRHRLQQVEINAERIDREHRPNFRERIEKVRRELDEAERAQAAGGHEGGEVWSSLDAEIHALEGRLRP